MLKTAIPKHLAHQTKRINAEVEFRHSQSLASTIKPAKRRISIVINGVTSSGKSKLAELIMQRAQDRGILEIKNVSYEEYRGAKLWDKIPIGFSRYEGI